MYRKPRCRSTTLFESVPPRGSRPCYRAGVRLHLLVLLLLPFGFPIGCVFEEVGEGAVSDAPAPLTEEEREAKKKAEALEVWKKTPKVDREGGHKDGPLGTPRASILKLVTSREREHLRDGRTLQAYRTMAARSSKIGDAVFTEARWWFSRDNLLRRHQIWEVGMTRATCDQAARILAAFYGPPTLDTRNVKVWTGDRIRAVWRDLTDKAPVSRCEVEWRDLSFYGPSR